MADPTPRQVMVGLGWGVGLFIITIWLFVAVTGVAVCVPALYGAVLSMRQIRTEAQMRRSVDEVAKWANGFEPTTGDR